MITIIRKLLGHDSNNLVLIPTFGLPNNRLTCRQENYKLFKTNNMSMIDDCRMYFNFKLPSALLVQERLVSWINIVAVTIKTLK